MWAILNDNGVIRGRRIATADDVPAGWVLSNVELSWDAQDRLEQVWDAGNLRNRTAAEIVAAVRADRLEVVRAEAASRITAKWPLWAQNNCALGIYPEATVTQCAADIAAVIAASNAAEDAIEAATTVAEVEAVTATWPTL